MIAAGHSEKFQNKLPRVGWGRGHAVAYDTCFSVATAPVAPHIKDLRATFLPRYYDGQRHVVYCSFLFLNPWRCGSPSPKSTYFLNVGSRLFNPDSGPTVDPFVCSPPCESNPQDVGSIRTAKICILLCFQLVFLGGESTSHQTFCETRWEEELSNIEPLCTCPTGKR